MVLVRRDLWYNVWELPSHQALNQSRMKPMFACLGLIGNMSETEIVIKRLTIFSFLDILNKKVILLTTLLPQLPLQEFSIKGSKRF